MISSFRQIGETTFDLSFHIDAWPVSGQVANVKIHMMNFDFSQPAKGNFGHCSWTRGHNFLQLPLVLTQVIPCGLKSPARITEFTDELVHGQRTSDCNIGFSHPCNGVLVASLAFHRALKE